MEEKIMRIENDLEKNIFDVNNKVASRQNRHLIIY